MSCQQIRSAISALQDGEDPGVSESALARHVAACRSCQSYAEQVKRLHREMRVQPAPRVPDLTPAILHSLEPSGRNDRVTGIRICLVLISLVQLATAIPPLFLGAEDGLPTHAARHAGAFAVALAVGFAVAAWKPSHATGIVTVTGVLVICLIGAGLADVAAGRTGTIAEFGHAPELVGLSALCLLRHQISSTPRQPAV